MQSSFHPSQDGMPHAGTPQARNPCRCVFGWEVGGSWTDFAVSLVKRVTSRPFCLAFFVPKAASGAGRPRFLAKGAGGALWPWRSSAVWRHAALGRASAGLGKGKGPVAWVRLRPCLGNSCECLLIGIQHLGCGISGISIPGHSTSMRSAICQNLARACSHDRTYRRGASPRTGDAQKIRLPKMPAVSIHAATARQRISMT